MRDGGRLARLVLALCAGFSEPGRRAAHSWPEAPVQLGYDADVLRDEAARSGVGSEGAVVAKAASAGGGELRRVGPRPGERLALAIDDDELSLPPGRWPIEVAVPPRHHVTIGVRGAAGALRDFEIVGGPGLGRVTTGALADDGRLPAFVSFETPRSADRVLVVVDVERPVELVRAASKRFTRGARTVNDGAVPLVGFPYPSGRAAGYRLETPPRYAFVRADVAAALKGAFKQTRRRFRRNGITIGDASQWNGDRPAIDLGHRRHITHQGGRDIDLGLPSRQGRSRVWTRCRAMKTPPDRAECAEGSVAEAFDAERMAYFLAALVEGPRRVGDEPSPNGPAPLAEVEAILLDREYILAVTDALPKLRAQGWVGAAAYAALSEGRLLRHSPWHLDHVHVRFAGAPAVTPEALAFEVLPEGAAPPNDSAASLEHRE